MTNTIQFVSAPCGSGKTYSMAQYISVNRDLSNFLIVCPTKVLIEQTERTLLANGVKADVIHGETQEESTIKTIIKHLNKSLSIGGVLIITLNAFLMLPYFHHRDRWIVIMDEVPQIDAFCPIEGPHDKKTLNKLFKVKGSINDTILQVVPKSRSAIERLLKQDDLPEDMDKLLRQCLSTCKDVFVDAASWASVMEGKPTSKENNEGRLYFITMLNPSRLMNGVVLGANIEDSLLYHWFRRFYSVTWTKHEEIGSGLRRLPSLASRLSIYYFFKQKYSKRLANTPTDSGSLAIDVIEQNVAEFIGDKPCLYAMNNDRESTILSTRDNMKRIPVLSNGLNDYDGYDAIFIAAALNREPKHYKMLECLGFTSDQVQEASAHEIYYQSVLRTSLRKPDSTSHVIAIVPDKASAKRISTLTGSNDVQQLCSIIDPKTTLTSAQKQKRYAMKHIKELLLNPTSIPFPYKTSKDSGIDIERGTKLDHRYRKYVEIMGDNPLTIIVTLHDEPRDNTPEQHSVLEMDVQQFIKLLREHAETIIYDKEDHTLFNPGYYIAPDDFAGYRKQDYFVQSSCMVLDFDGGTLSPQEFQRIFWDDAGSHQKRSFVICNSFSRSKENPNKFRAVLFYTRPAISLAEHEAVLYSVVRRLEESGYSEEDVKLDRNCKSGVQSFWLPCTNINQQDSAFFIAKGTKTTEIRKYGIDPGQWLKTVAVDTDAERIVTKKDKPPPTREQVDQATALVRSLPEGRYVPFFEAAMRLSCLGLSLSEVERELEDVARADPKMKRWVRGAVRSVKTYRRF